jgi:hypothetical protein
MVASAVGTVVIALLLVLVLYGQQSFALMTSYSELDSQRRNAVMVFSKELREATRVTQAGTNADGKTLTLTNAVEGTTVRLVWDTEKGTLSMEKPNVKAVLLTGCEQWNYTLYDGAPVIAEEKISFTPSASLARCKLVEMSWACTKLIGGKTTASRVEAVRFGLRNNVR